MTTPASATSTTTQPLAATASKVPTWSKAVPTEQDWYWHWNGDPDSGPLPTSVLYSGFQQACFVSAGQLGLREAVPCKEYGGYWMKMEAPEIPDCTLDE